MNEHFPKNAHEPPDMDSLMSAFKGNTPRLKKYVELALFNQDASPYSYLSKNNMRRIALVLTTKCNMHCLWCHRHEPAVSDYLHKEMPIETVRKLLPKLKGFDMLHWAGLGEPLMYSKIYELTREARELFPVVKLTTNGSFLTEENANKLIWSRLNCLEVSIDGFDGSTNKRCRGIDESVILEGLDYLSAKSNLPIQINSALSKDNYDALWNAVDRLKDIKSIFCLHTIPLFMTTYMRGQGIEPVTLDEHKQLLCHWKKRIDHFGLDIRLAPDLGGVRMDPVIMLKKRHNICFSVFEDPFINVEGFLSPCGRLQHISLVNLLDKTFDDAWNERAMLKWRRAQIKGNYGRDCVRECNMKNTRKLSSK